MSSELPTRFEAGHARARALGSEERFATDRRDRVRTLRRRGDDVGSVSERELCGAARRRCTRPRSLLGKSFPQPNKSVRVDSRLPVCFAEFSNRRVNSGERLQGASLIARTVTVEHHGGPHADAQRADDRTCGLSSRRAARFVAGTARSRPAFGARAEARAARSFSFPVAAICLFHLG